jgi:glycosyltransferase involved in cell wall biosynthesis
MPRVAVLVNFVPPYRLPLFEAINARVGQMRVFVSTPVEPNRPWPVRWGTLDVVVQRSVMLKKRWKRSGGFSDTSYVHLPLDTLSQLRRYRPDVIIAGELGVRSCLAAAYAAVRVGTPLILWATVSELTEQRRGRLREWLRPALLSRADAVLVNGASGARYIGSLGVPCQKIQVIPYSTDVSRFAQASTERVAGEPRQLFYAGLLIERKGLAEFLEALARWGRRNSERRVVLRLAGDGPERRRLEALPMPPNTLVQFLGNVAYEELPALYRSADVFVLPTLEDEWGVVVNEALASGLPVLGSRFSQAVEELIEDGQTGWTFKPDDPVELDNALSRAMSATDVEVRRLGNAARYRAAALAPDVVADRISEVVRCLATK